MTFQKRNLDTTSTEDFFVPLKVLFSSKLKQHCNEQFRIFVSLYVGTLSHSALPPSYLHKHYFSWTHNITLNSSTTIYFVVSGGEPVDTEQRKQRSCPPLPGAFALALLLYPTQSPQPHGGQL